MRRVEVIKEHESRLKRDVWGFIFIESDHALKCQSYDPQERPTLRHKYRSTGMGYDAYRRGQRGYGGQPEPEIPVDVQADALSQFWQGMRVMHFPPKD